MACEEGPIHMETKSLHIYSTSILVGKKAEEKQVHASIMHLLSPSPCPLAKSRRTSPPYGPMVHAMLVKLQCRDSSVCIRTICYIQQSLLHIRRQP